MFACDSWQLHGSECLVLVVFWGAGGVVGGSWLGGDGLLKQDRLVNMCSFALAATYGWHGLQACAYTDMHDYFKAQTV